MLEMVDLVEVVVINLPVVGMEYLVKEVLGVTQLGPQLLQTMLVVEAVEKMKLVKMELVDKQAMEAMVQIQGMQTIMVLLEVAVVVLVIILL
tara:strand:- start:165 stop:440 length:276 start_codon:yes stop_codon:yes gene_type:complete